METLIKYVDKFIDAIDGRLTIWISLAATIVVAGLTLVVMSSQAEGKEMHVFEMFPYMETILSFYYLNLLYIYGVVLNTIFFLVYVHYSKEDFGRYGGRLEGLKHFTVYTLCGYGGINLSIYPAILVMLIVYVSVESVIFIVDKIKQIPVPNFEETLKSIQKESKKY